MKTPKTYYPVIAAAVIAAGAFIPTSFGGEKAPAPKSTQSEAAKSDPVLGRVDKMEKCPEFFGFLE